LFSLIISSAFLLCLFVREALAAWILMLDILIDPVTSSPASSPDSSYLNHAKDSLLRDPSNSIEVGSGTNLAISSADFKSTLISTLPDFSISTHLNLNDVSQALDPSYSSPLITNLISSIALRLFTFLRLITASHLRASETVILPSATFTLEEPAAALTTHNLVPESLVFPHLNV
jgi:hypothetical protein